MVVTLWATELFPIWATSLCIPVLVVWLQVYPYAGHVGYSVAAAKNAAEIVFSKFFSSAVMLALGAFTMSAALTKYELSDRLAFMVLSRVGNRPWVVTLVVMFLGVFLSMWVSNVAAPVVVISLVRPLLQEIPETDTFNKVILLGIAFSNNIGGMTTPIASPQNIIGIQYINDVPGQNIGWPKWLIVSIPYSIVCTLAAFLFLWVFYRPKIAVLPPIRERKLKPFTFRHFIVMFVCFSTILLWALSSLTSEVTGDNGITALIPVFIFCAFKLMTKDDFKALSWDVLILLGGGLVLGSAIQKSGLLEIIAKEISYIVKGQPDWVVMASFAALTWFFGNFMSHTVAAIIITPIIISVTCPGNLCGANTNMVMVAVGAILVDSGAMALPMTSFPNAATYNENKSDGTPYLDSSDYIKTGFPIGIIELVLLGSVGFGLFKLWPLFHM